MAGFEATRGLSDEALRDALRAGEAPERLFAAWRLALRLGGEVAPEIAAAAWSDPSPDVREHLTHVLAGYREVDALAAMARRDPDAHVRAAALRALARLGVGRELVLEAASGDASALVRLASIALLGQDAAAADLLERERDPDVRLRLVQTYLDADRSGEALSHAASLDPARRSSLLECLAARGATVRWSALAPLADAGSREDDAALSRLVDPADASAVLDWLGSRRERRTELYLPRVATTAERYRWSKLLPLSERSTMVDEFLLDVVDPVDRDAAFEWLGPRLLEHGPGWERGRRAYVEAAASRTSWTTQEMDVLCSVLTAIECLLADLSLWPEDWPVEEEFDLDTLRDDLDRLRRSLRSARP